MSDVTREEILTFCREHGFEPTRMQLDWMDAAVNGRPRAEIVFVGDQHRKTQATKMVEAILNVPLEVQFMREGAAAELCRECGTPIKPDAYDPVYHADTDEPYHWSCLQEAYERERLADREES